MANKTNANIGFEKQLWYIPAAFVKQHAKKPADIFETENEIRRKLGAIGYEL